MPDEDYYFDALRYWTHCYHPSHQPKVKPKRSSTMTMQDRVANRRFITQAQADEMWDHYMLEGHR